MNDRERQIQELQKEGEIEKVREEIARCEARRKEEHANFKALRLARQRLADATAVLWVYVLEVRPGVVEGIYGISPEVKNLRSRSGKFRFDLNPDHSLVQIEVPIQNGECLILLEPGQNVRIRMPNSARNVDRIYRLWAFKSYDEIKDFQPSV